MAIEAQETALAGVVGSRAPDEIFCVHIGLMERFGLDTEVDIFNPEAGYHYLSWSGAKVGPFWARREIDLSVIMNLVTGNIAFLVKAESRELAESLARKTARCFTALEECPQGEIVHGIEELIAGSLPASVFLRMFLRRETV